MVFGWDDAAMIALPMITSYLGNQAGAGDRKNAEAARQAALAAFEGVNIPDAEKMKLYLEQLSNSGQLSPEQEQLINQSGTSFEGIALNPALKAKQEQALAQMSQISEKGYTPEDQAIQEMARKKAADMAQAEKEAALMKAQSTGTYSSGAALMAQLDAGQKGANRLQDAALQEAARSAQARLAATEQLGNMSTSMRSQDYGEQAQLAQAKDAIARYNAQNAQSVNARRTQANNAAQQYNLGNAQRIADQNVALRNQQQQYNNNLIQQNFQNQMQRASGMAGQYQANAANYQQQAGNTAAGWGQVGQGLGSAYANYSNNQATNNLANAMKPASSAPTYSYTSPSADLNYNFGDTLNKTTTKNWWDG